MRNKSKELAKLREYAKDDDYFPDTQKWIIKSIFRKLQFSESLLSCPDRCISIKLIDDILNLIADFNPSSDFFFRMEYCDAERLKKFELFFSPFSDCKSLKDVYELFSGSQVGVIDNTWKYQVESLCEKNLILKVCTNQKTQELYREKYFGSSAIDQYRAGVGAGTASYLSYNCNHWKIEQATKKNNYMMKLHYSFEASPQ